MFNFFKPKINKCGKLLKKYVDEGAINWKIGSVEKFCSIIAAKHFVIKYRENPINASMNDMVDGLSSSKKQLSSLGLMPPAEFNFNFHLKTGETLLWFGQNNKLSWEQLFEAIDYLETSYEKQVIERYGRK